MTSRDSQPSQWPASLPRWVLHVCFWMVFLGVNLFTELYLSSSFQQHPSVPLLMKALVLQVVVLAIKMAVVYYLLYLFLPRWAASKSRSLLVLEAAAVLLLGMVAYRVAIQWVGWRLLYGEVPQGISAASFVARWIYSLLDLLEVAGVAFAIKLLRLRLVAERRERHLMQEKLDSEMKLLRAQVQPHFLFNSLNTIYALSRQGAEDTPEAVMRLSQILRYVLYESGKPTVALSRELALVQDYVDLQALRFGQRVQVRMHVEPELEELQVAPMLIFPLVENAFKHGVAPDGAASQLEVAVSAQEGVVKVHVGNHIWKQTMHHAEGEGIGLKGVRRLLELQYLDFTFQHRQVGDRFLVDLRINTHSHAGTALPDR